MPFLKTWAENARAQKDGLSEISGVQREYVDLPPEEAKRRRDAAMKTLEELMRGENQNQEPTDREKPSETDD